MDTMQQLYKKGLEYYNKGNLTQAIICFRQAAEQGNVDAQLKLSYCYWNGKGVEWNVREALKWQKAAAEQGDPEDMYFYGEMCLAGEVIDEFGADIADEGIEWLGKAVAKGSKEALNRLSDIIPSDTEQAAFDKECQKVHKKVSYDEDDIRRMATVSAQVRDMAVEKKIGAFSEAKKLAMHSCCPIDYDIGHALYEKVEALEKNYSNDRYEKLVDAITYDCGRIFRVMLENFSSSIKRGGD